MSEEKNNYFWEKRPKSLIEKIDKAYDRIKIFKESSWGIFNGYEDQYVSGIKDRHLFDSLISQGIKKGRKEFYFIDLGCGNFQFGRTVTNHINDKFKGQNIKVNIFSLRGEKNEAQEKKQEGTCTLYEYGNFKIENLVEEFKKRGHELDSQIDFISSNWCMRHLADPVGTFAQMHHLLRNNTGIMAFTGFFFGTGKNIKSGPFRKNMVELLANTDEPFFVFNEENVSNLNNFILRKTSDKITIPLVYSENSKNVRNKGYQIGSDNIQIFDKNNKWKNFKPPCFGSLEYYITWKFSNKYETWRIDPETKHEHILFQFAPYCCMSEKDKDFFLDIMPLNLLKAIFSGETSSIRKADHKRIINLVMNQLEDKKISFDDIKQKLSSEEVNKLLTFAKKFPNQDQNIRDFIGGLEAQKQQENKAPRELELSISELVQRRNIAELCLQ